MCRLLAIKSERPVDIAEHFIAFSHIAENSEEYQGHGWGMSYITQNGWETYHNINPIWKDTLESLPKTRLALLHARSAFQDTDITVENNMPFLHGDLSFVFNGELRGVRIREDGRIGAEKIFNFIQRFDQNGLKAAMDRAIPIIEKKTDYIRALNFVISDGKRLFVSNYYSENPSYFGMHAGYGKDFIVISSEPYETNAKWEKLDNHTLEVFR